jgi:hypothetical protein
VNSLFQIEPNFFQCNIQEFEKFLILTFCRFVINPGVISILMAFTFDLNLIACPTCQKENDMMLEVIGRHEFPNNRSNRTPIYMKLYAEDGKGHLKHKNSCIFKRGDLQLLVFYFA